MSSPSGADSGRTWTGDQLDRLGTATEIELVLSRRRVPIWIVRVGDQLYVRSWRGAAGGWYRTVRRSQATRVRVGGTELDVRFVEPDEDVDDLVDQAYREKYAGYGSAYVEPMVAPEARATTLRLEPGPG